MSQNKEHALWSPSSAWRWQYCPKSVSYQSETNEAAEEGTRQHEWNEKLMRKECTGKDIPEEHYEYAILWRKYCKSLQRELVDFHDFNEIKLYASASLFGTLDYLILGYSKNGTLQVHVVDYKHGLRNEVDADNNPQLMLYAYFALKLCRHMYGNIPTHIHMHIVQPRLHNVAYVAKLSTQLEEEVKSRFIVVADNYTSYPGNTLHRDAPAKPGSHCKWCPGIGTCPEQFNAQKDILLKNVPTLEVKGTKVADVVKEKLVSISISDKVALLNQKVVIEETLKQVGRELHALAQNEKLPGLKLVNGRSNRKWLLDDTETGMELRKLGVEEPYNKKLKGLGEIEKEIGKDKLGELTYKPTPNTLLVPDSDPRTEVLDYMVLIDDAPPLEE